MRKLQNILFVVSCATLALLPLHLLPLPEPVWFRRLVYPPLLSAAIGYLTNFVALAMLFLPYDRHGFHWLRLLTLGFWKQGMIPARKADLGRALAEEIPRQLLDPETIARELGAALSRLADDPVWLDRLRDQAPEALHRELRAGIRDAAAGRLGRLPHADRIADRTAELLSAAIPALSARLLDSQRWRDWARQRLIPALRDRLDRWFAAEGRAWLVEQLALPDRIERAVAAQDVREFHAMIDRIAAEHLGMIQILGYFLGLLIGIFQLIGEIGSIGT